MKKYYFIIMLFIFVLSINAQQNITIGTATTEGNNPFNSWYGYGRSASLYTASEIGVYGSISALKWQVSNNSSVSIPVKIYIKSTVSSTLSADTWANTISGATLVYAGNVVFSSTGWKEITLSTPFDYTANNLMVLCEANLGATGTSQIPKFTYTEQTSGHQSWQADTTPPSSNGTVNAYRPNIQISLYAQMTYVSANCSQPNTNYLLNNSLNQPLLLTNISTAGSTTPLTLSQMGFELNNGTYTSDISGAKLYYTGSSATFSTAYQIGSLSSISSSTLTFPLSFTLEAGNNYFWLALDVKNSAVEYHTLDAQGSQFVLGGITRTPDSANPSGSRTIRYPLNGIKVIGTGETYSTLKQAVQELNDLGTGSGGILFRIKAGETFTDSVEITTTGTSAKPIVFQKYGSGVNPIIQRYGTISANEAIIKVNSADYITFDGFTLRQAGSGSSLELGFYFAGSLTDGCENNVVKNCVVDLSKGNSQSKGIALVNNAGTASAINRDNQFLNNQITDCSYGYYLLGNSSYYDDQNTISNSESGTSSITGVGGSNYPAWGVYIGYNSNLTVSNTQISFNTNNAGIYGIHSALGSCNTLTIFNNQISQLNTSSTSAVYGIYGQAGSVFNITANEINGLSSSGNCHGVYCNGGTSNIKKNKVYNLVYNGTSTGVVNGIYTVTTYSNIFNNMVYDIKATAGTTNSLVLNNTAGINVGGSDSKVYYNSVLLDYTSTGVSNKSAALNIISQNTLVDCRNNILVNNCNMSTGSAAIGFRYPSTNYANLSANSNHNLFYAGTPGSKNLLFSDGTNNVQTLSSVKTLLSPRESASVTENPPFLSVSSPYNLHIKTDLATQVESGGSAVSQESYDIDGSSRASTPDIGADEGSFILQDTSAPLVSYTVLTNSTVSAVKTLNVTFTDVSGTDLNTHKPRVYYKKSGDANSFGVANNNSGNGWKWVEGTSQLTLDYSKLRTTPVLGDVIQYFVVAQDISTNANLGAEPGTGFAGTSVSDISTAPTSPNSYQIVNSFAGNYNIGIYANCQYTNLSGINGVFNALNQGVVSGNITLTIVGNVTETSAVALNQMVEEGAGNFTITVVPHEAATHSLQLGQDSDGIIELNGADRVIFDGRYGGSGSYLKFKLVDGVSTNTPTNGLVIGTGSKNITVRNCLFSNLYQSNANAGVVLQGDNDDVLIESCTFEANGSGIIIQGSSQNISSNVVINNNIIGTDDSAKYLLRYGIYSQYSDNLTITNNTIKNIITSNANPAGLVLSTGTTNAVVNANKISGIYYDRSNSTGAWGIDIDTYNMTSNLLISNNVVYNILSKGWNNLDNDALAGIRIRNFSGGIKLYNNSVNLYGYSDNSMITYNAALFIANTTANLRIRNNIFKNSISNRTTAGSKSFIIASDVIKTAFKELDNNIYYCSGTQGTLGRYLYNDVTSLTQWRTNLEKDINSFVANPHFASETDLTPSNSDTTAYYINGKGYPLSEVDKDYLQNTRNTLVTQGPTDIGAYEITPPEGISPTPAVISSPVANTDLNCMVSNMELGTIRFNAGGTLPTAINMYYYSGTSITSAPDGRSVSRSYWEASASGGSNFSYKLTLKYQDTDLGELDESSMLIAKRSSTVWEILAPANGYFYQRDLTNNTLTVYGTNLKTFSEFVFVNPLGDETLPVNLSTFNGTYLEADNSVAIKWMTENQSDALGYNLYRSSDNNYLNSLRINNSIITEGIEQSTACSYSYTDNALEDSDLYYYWLEDLSYEGTSHIMGPILVKVVHNSSDGPEIPLITELKNAYPNPFNPVTTIPFSLKKSGQVMIEIFNIKGQRVSKLMDTELAAGYHKVIWKGLNNNNQKVGSGVYFYKMQAGETVQIKKILLLK